MESKQTKFILLVIAIIIVVIGIGLVVNKVQGPDKYDGFAQSLKANGAEFYGAFWCPHCQAQKALFGNSKKYLPYIECSNPDKSSTQICIDKKIENFPTWMFKNGITLTSSDTIPTICSIITKDKAATGEAEICAQVASQYYKTWVFSNHKFSIKSPVEPVHTGDVWKFPVGSEITGEVPLEFLAAQIGYTLPQ